MVSENKSSVVKVKQDGPSKPRSDLLKNKISDQKRPIDSKNKVTTTVTKTEVKNLGSSSKSTTKTTTVTKREKKVFSLPGQKYEVPEEREPLRIFYESLSKQIPSSEMAQFWLMEHGMLSPDKAKKAYERKQAKQKQLRMGTPVKSLPPPPPPSRNKPESSNKQQMSRNKPESSNKQQMSKTGEGKAKKRIINDNDEDDDFILSPKRRKG